MTPRRAPDRGAEAPAWSNTYSQLPSEGTPERLRLVGEADVRLEAAEAALINALAVSTGDLADAGWNAAKLIGRARLFLRAAS